MDALDCPAGDQATPTRNNGVTIQQALALWNSAFIARQCKHVATRVEAADSSVPRRTTRAVRWLLGREPRAEELRDKARLEDRRYSSTRGRAAICR